MQQPGAMFPVMPSFPPNNITTEQIQKTNMRQTKLIAYEIRDVIEANTSEKYLDENKKLILAILDNQNLGKLAECAQFQAQLQKNLMYLAAIADAQPQTPTMPTQMSPHPAMQQGGFYMQQHPMAQQQGIFPPRGPPFNSPHTLQDLQATSSQGQMGLRPNNGHNDNIGASNSGLNDMLGGGGSISKQQDKAGSDAQGGNGDGEEAQ